MNNIPEMSDKLAIMLSIACVAHCFLTPSFAILAYGFFPFALDNEFIHALILLVAFPISSFALFKGYTLHKTIVAVPIAFFGLGCLIVAVILGEAILSEAGEKGLTVLGSMFVVTAHYKNYRFCKNS